MTRSQPDIAAAIRRELRDLPPGETITRCTLWVRVSQLNGVSPSQLYRTIEAMTKAGELMAIPPARGRAAAATRYHLASMEAVQ